MPTTHRRDPRGPAGHLAGHPTDRRHQLGDGVLGRDRISKDRGVHHPPPPASKDPSLLHHPPDRLVDPMRPLRAGQPTPPIDQRRRMKAPVVQGHPHGDLPAQIAAGRLRRLTIRQVVQALQGQDRGRHRRRQRRTSPARGEQVRELLVGKQLPTMVARNQNMLPSGTKCPTSAAASNSLRSAGSTPCTPSLPRPASTLGRETIADYSEAS
jgi:hypothetical protein